MPAQKVKSPRVTLVTIPATPVPGKPFRVRGERQDQTKGTHFRLWCLAAPPGTKLRKELDESRASRVVFQALVPISDRPTDGANRFEFDVTLEKGGGYVLQVDELQIGAGFTGGYESDPRGAPSEEIKTVGTTTLYVASPLTTQLGCGSDTATLKLFVHHDTVIQTEQSVHGETTPRIDLSASASPKARIASDSSDVINALAGLAGQTAEDLVGDLSGGLDTLLQKIGAHLTQGGRHYSNDTDNTIASSYLGANTASSRAAALQAVRRLLAQHMRNDSGGGTGSAGYHSSADWENLPLDAAGATDALTDAIAQADLWRAHEAHRLSAVHKGADNVNKASALPPLLELHRAFIAALAAATVTTPSTAQSGAALLITQLGFKDA